MSQQVAISYSLLRIYVNIKARRLTRAEEQEEKGFDHGYFQLPSCSASPIREERADNKQRSL